MASSAANISRSARASWRSPGGLFAILCRGATVLSGQHAMLRRVRAILRGAPAVLAGTHNDLDTNVRPAPGLLNLSVELRHRQIARGGGLIAGQRREIARLRDGVALVRDVQTLSAGLLTPLGGALTDVTRDLMLMRFHAGSKVAITRRLVAVSSDLVALGARLVTVRARLIRV